MKRKNAEQLTCPKCGSPLFLSHLVFTDEGGDLIGCCDCLSLKEQAEAFEAWTIKEYVQQNYITYIDHQIDRIKEEW